MIDSKNYFYFEKCIELGPLGKYVSLGVCGKTLPYVAAIPTPAYCGSDNCAKAVTLIRQKPNTKKHFMSLVQTYKINF